MEAGKLRYIVGLYQPATGSVNSAGETVRAMDWVADVYADVQQPSAREQIRNNVTEASKDYAILIRYRADITPEWEIDHEGLRLSISGIMPIGFKQGLSIMAHA